MKTLRILLLTVLTGAMVAGNCHATSDATCLVYQPIDMRSEGTVIEMPKGAGLTHFR